MKIVKISIEVDDVLHDMDLRQRIYIALGFIKREDVDIEILLKYENSTEYPQISDAFVDDLRLIPILQNEERPIELQICFVNLNSLIQKDKKLAENLLRCMMQVSRDLRPEGILLTISASDPLLYPETNKYVFE
jgi:DNA-binding MltR family transcriptional regulator